MLQNLKKCFKLASKLLQNCIKMLRDVTVDGSDYSPALLDIARKVLVDGEFECLEANKIQVEKVYDHVTMNSKTTP